MDGKEGKYQQVKGQKITLAVVQQLQKNNLKEKWFFSPHEVQSTHFIIVSADLIFQDSAWDNSSWLLAQQREV